MPPRWQARTTPRVQRNGQALSARLWACLADSWQASRSPLADLRVIQGSWSHARASAGTHAGGGAADLAVAPTRDLTLAVVDELRRRGCAAWFRSPEFGWPKSAGAPHVHVIMCDEPNLSAAAIAQVKEFRAGRNGLASGRDDPHARPAAHRFFWLGSLPPRPKGVLKRGSTGASVRNLQLALGETPDGAFGPVTARAALAAIRTVTGEQPITSAITPELWVKIIDRFWC